VWKSPRLSYSGRRALLKMVSASARAFDQPCQVSAFDISMSLGSDIGDGLFGLEKTNRHNLA
jgi:hypothetical protein